MSEWSWESPGPRFGNTSTGSTWRSGRSSSPRSSGTCGDISRTGNRGSVQTRLQTVLGELDKSRKGLAFYAILVICLSAACFFFAEPTLRYLVRLLGRRLVAYSPAEGFLAFLSLSLY